jgi:hypothetical protein
MVIQVVEEYIDMEDVHIENSSDKFWLLDVDNIQKLPVDQVEIEVEFFDY